MTTRTVPVVRGRGDVVVVGKGKRGALSALAAVVRAPASACGGGARFRTGRNSRFAGGVMRFATTRRGHRQICALTATEQRGHRWESNTPTSSTRSLRVRACTGPALSEICERSFDAMAGSAEGAHFTRTTAPVGDGRGKRLLRADAFGVGGAPARPRPTATARKKGVDISTDARVSPTMTHRVLGASPRAGGCASIGKSVVPPAGVSRTTRNGGRNISARVGVAKVRGSASSRRRIRWPRNRA